MEVLKETKSMRLSPVLAAAFAATAVLSLSESVVAETAESTENSEELAPKDGKLTTTVPEILVNKDKPVVKPIEVATNPVVATESKPEFLTKPTATVIVPQNETIEALPSIQKVEKLDTAFSISEIVFDKTKPVIKVESQLEVDISQIAIPTRETSIALDAIPTHETTQETSVALEAIPTHETTQETSVALEAIPTSEITQEIQFAESSSLDLGKDLEISLAENQELSSLKQLLIDPSVYHWDSQETSLNLANETPTDVFLWHSPENPNLAQTQTLAQSSNEPLVLVAEVLVVGAATQELENLIYDTVSTRPGSTTTRSQLQQDINNIFATGFFANATVIPEDTPLGVRITFQVETNPVLREVVVDSIPPDSQQAVPPETVREIFSEQYGEILNLQQLQSDIQELNQWYRERGFDLAQVVGVPQIAEDGTVTLVVAEGVIGDVRVRFLNEEGEEVEGRTRDFIVTREVELQPGDVFNRQTAQRDLQRVFGLGLFDDVQLSFAPAEDPSEVIVNLDVVEGNTGSLAAGAGFSSASGIFGTVSYQQGNFGGNNQTLGGEFQLGTRSLLFDLRFTDPWIGGDPYRTSYTVNAFRRQSISLIFDGGEEDVDLPNGDTPRVVRTGGGINFSRPLAPSVFSSPDWTLSTGLQYQRVQITDADGDTTPRDENGNLLSFSDSGEDDLILFQFGATRDRRNDPLRPTSGSFLRLGVDQSAPFGSGSILMNRIRASYSFYLPVDLTGFADGPEALAFNVQGGNIFGDLPPYEAFSLGGTNSVRGFDEGDVGSGRRYFQATAEYRFPVLSIFSGALFADFGTDLGSGSSVPGDPAGERDKPGTGFGYGLGVRIQSPLGPIRIDYGLNSEGDSQFHFGIGERF